MPDLKYLPISYLDSQFLSPLMKEEEKAWMDDLCWDYSAIRKILVSFMNQKLLPGYVAVCEQEAIGYTYFLMNKTKGIIGSIYVRKTDFSQEITRKLLSLTISGLKDSHRIQRVEAQIMPFNNLKVSEVFIQNGFRYFPRCYLKLDLDASYAQTIPSSGEKIIPWDFSDLSPAAGIVLESYKNQTDAAICADYRTVSGCEGYLRSIVENPGCGVFMPQTSFMGLDENSNPCGVIIGCRISDQVGMIPQIAVHPSFQGRKLGEALMNRAFKKFLSLGFRKITLTVTPENRRAYEWYCRLGFKICKEFGAFIWER
jgi:ribosomal protein S18 acetylase RimI-like enzyme